MEEYKASLIYNKNKIKTNIIIHKNDKPEQVVREIYNENFMGDILEITPKIT